MGGDGFAGQRYDFFRIIKNAVARGANVTKRFVCLRLKFCFMKECGHTSSLSFAVARPYKRHYNSDLSIWLSVDLMSDKYPSTSPYTYCANNPVRLVDPNGMTWETPEDEKKADRLTQLAQKGIAWNQTKIEKYNNKLAKISNPNRQNQLKRKINEYETRNEYLEYGIYGLKLMAESTDFSFHFGDVKTGEVCYSEIRPDDELLSSGMITIYSDSYLATQWHECTHIWDWMTNYFGGEQYFYDCTRQLVHNENVDYDVETHALQSEFAFSKGRNHCGMNLFRYSDRFDDNTLYNSRSILDVSKKSYCNP